jgi:glutamate-1-semialdehyde 2,1-aminomutase
MINKRPKSAAFQERATQVMPLGVNSNTRFWGKGRNLYVENAKGAYVWDVDGNQYIDYRLAFGPVLLGYACDAVDEKVYEVIRKGVSIGLTREIEIEAAEKIVSMVPSVEMVRLVNSGTEATMHALRVARAYTGREKVIKFEGGYHGSHDYVLFSTYAPPSTYGNRFSPIPIPASSGIPAALQNLVITLPYNDCTVLEKTLKRVGNEVAAIITEPMLGNFGSIEPEPGFLEYLRDKCNEYGILLIFDEVKTGFRIAPGGAGEVYGVISDLTTFAKSIGNGYPVAAFGGRKEIMSILGNGVSQGGTYAGNAIGAAAVYATMDLVQTQPVHKTIQERGYALQNGLRKVFKRAGVQALITRHPAIFGLCFGIEAARDAREWAKSDQNLYRCLAEALLDRGILIDDDPREPWCLCFAHSEDDIQKTLIAVESAIQACMNLNSI